MSVRVNPIIIFSSYLVSQFCSHQLTQYHFTSWADHGIPEYATSIYLDASTKDIIQREDQCLSIAGRLTYQQILRPTNVTSSLILILIQLLPFALVLVWVLQGHLLLFNCMVLQQVEQEGYINIIETINQLRCKHMKMVKPVRDHILNRKLLIKLFKFNLPVYRYTLMTFLTYSLYNVYTPQHFHLKLFLTHYTFFSNNFVITKA